MPPLRRCASAAEILPTPCEVVAGGSALTCSVASGGCAVRYACITPLPTSGDAQGGVVRRACTTSEKRGRQVKASRREATLIG